MALRYRVQAQVGTYNDANGNEKKKYVDVGVIMDKKDGGFIMKIEAIPIGWDGWAYLNVPEARPKGSGGGQRRQAPPQSGGNDEMDDDIPF